MECCFTKRHTMTNMKCKTSKYLNFKNIMLCVRRCALCAAMKRLAQSRIEDKSDSGPVGFSHDVCE